MSLNFVDLNEEVRQFMKQEVELDQEQNKLYISPRLTIEGCDKYVELLLQSIQFGNEQLLARDLQPYMNSTEIRNGKNIKVPHNAHETLAEGEFKKYYMRALCVIAIERKLLLEVYRAKNVSEPRLQSQMNIGELINPQDLLNDLRKEHPNQYTSSGRFFGPNSGLCVRLKRDELKFNI